MCKLFVFLDESGNFSFSESGTKYLIFTALTTKHPSIFNRCLGDLKDRLLLEGLDIKGFHASEDKQKVRDSVFDILSEVKNFNVYAIIVEKRKLKPEYHDVKKIYPYICKQIIDYILRNYKNVESIVFITDRVPMNKKRETLEKAIKETVKPILRRKQEAFHVYHHESYSNFALQVVDYCSWAIYKKWTDNEKRPYNKIKDKIESEFDIFKKGDKFFY